MTIPLNHGLPAIEFRISFADLFKHDLRKNILPYTTDVPMLVKGDHFMAECADHHDLVLVANGDVRQCTVDELTTLDLVSSGFKYSTHSSQMTSDENLAYLQNAFMSMTQTGSKSMVSVVPFRWPLYKERIPYISTRKDCGIRLHQCKDGMIYKLNSRNLSYGIFLAYKGGFVGIRQKFSDEFLDLELHYDKCPHHGTVSVIEEVEEYPFDRESILQYSQKCFGFLKSLEHRLSESSEE